MAKLSMPLNKFENRVRNEEKWKMFYIVQNIENTFNVVWSNKL